jgi:hypothetical protein
VGVAFELDTLLMLRFGAMFWQGAWGALAAEVSECLKQARDRGDLYASTGVIQLCGWVAHLARDAPSAARAELESAAAAWGKGFRTQEWFRLASAITIDLYEGDAVGAHRRIRDGWDEIERSFVLRLGLLRPVVHAMPGACAVAARDARREPPAARRSRAARGAGAAQRHGARPRAGGARRCGRGERARRSRGVRGGARDGGAVGGRRRDASARGGGAQMARRRGRR